MSNLTTIAPAGKYRVVAWRGGERYPTIEGDFDDRVSASKAASELLKAPDVTNASVFSQSGQCVFNALYPNRSPYEFNRPTSITRLAGLDDPLKRNRGSYRRK